MQRQVTREAYTSALTVSATLDGVELFGMQKCIVALGVLEYVWSDIPFDVYFIMVVPMMFNLKHVRGRLHCGPKY